MTNALLHAADQLDPPPLPTHAEWCQQELPHVFSLEFGQHHEWMFNLLGRQPQGVRAFEGAPRGSGKTTTAYIGIPMSCIALGTHRFIVLCKETQEEAEAQLKIIRGELERRPELAERWPNLRFVRFKSGKEKVNLNKEIQLVGGRIIAIGANASIRGIIRNAETGEVLRPDLFIFDDVETPDQARSKLRTDRLEEWIFADVSNLGGNTVIAKRMDVVGIGTTLDVDSLATRAIKRKGRFRTWRTASFPAETRDKQGKRVANWSKGQPLTFLDSLLNPESEQFVGGWTYAKEYLLDPLEREDSAVKRSSIVYGRVPRQQNGRVDLRFISHGMDPSTSEKAYKNNDPSAIVSAGLDAQNRVWVFRAWRGWVGKDRLFDIAEDYCEIDPNSAVSYEAVAGFRWGLQELRARKIPHRGVVPATDKLSRFQIVALLYEANARGFTSIIHDESLKDTVFEDELVSFPTADHDDFCDGLWLAVKLATNDGRRRRARPQGTGNGQSPVDNGQKRVVHSSAMEVVQ